MKRIIALALVASALILLPGCSALLDRERLVIKPYEWDKNAESALSGAEISNYSTLRSTIKWLVDNHMETGELTFFNYDGDAREDLYRACEEIKSNTALGAYSVDYMQPLPRQIVSYYRADLNITYKRTQQEVDSIVALPLGLRELPNALEDMLKNLETYAAFSVISSTVSAEEVTAMFRDAYLESILECPVRPEISINIYPDNGIERILEISLEYGYIADELVAMRADLKAALWGFGEYFDSEHEALSVMATVSRIAEICAPDETAVPGPTAMPDAVAPPANTAVGALLRGAADSEGYALACLAVLRNLGIECELVSGALDREAHYWNLVRIDGEYYHFDVSLLTSDGVENTCLRRDEDMAARYFWDVEGYPVCDGALTYAELFLVEEPET